MLKLFYAPGACSLAPHIVLEEGGEPYELQRIDLAKGEQRSAAYLKIHPLGRVPALRLDAGEVITENTAILPYLGKRFGLWPAGPVAEAQALAVIGFFASTVHPAHAHVARPERYASEPSVFANLQESGRKSFHQYLERIDSMLAGREWLADSYSVLDPYALVFYAWGLRREFPMESLKNFAALRERMLKRPAVRRVIEAEGVRV
jgi:glutathione S-transferase